LSGRTDTADLSGRRGAKFRDIGNPTQTLRQMVAKRGH
jgi:hypothetical protein